MADLVSLIAEVLREHRVRIRHGRYWVASCTGCSWRGPQPQGFRASCIDQYDAHIADLLADRLNLHEERRVPGTAYNPPEYRWVSDWTEEQR